MTPPPLHPINENDTKMIFPKRVAGFSLWDRSSTSSGGAQSRAVAPPDEVVQASDRQAIWTPPRRRHFGLVPPKGSLGVDPPETLYCLAGFETPQRCTGIAGLGG